MDKVKSLFSALVVYRHNINVLHWKVKGCHFDCLHELLDNYGDTFNSFIDEVAEAMMCVGCNPLDFEACRATVNDDAINHIVLSGESDYDTDDIQKNIGIMFTTLITMYTEVANSHELPSDVQAKLDEQLYWFRLENNYKNRRRLH